uniref:Reverse transcriptase domain-containing protein n=1 Tax=Anthoceros agrestis TaxID=41834 RepID=A0A6B9P6C7_9EMBR|nr:hypothetical protein [Anthoceros agrestis]
MRAKSCIETKYSLESRYCGVPKRTPEDTRHTVCAPRLRIQTEVKWGVGETYTRSTTERFFCSSPGELRKVKGETFHDNGAVNQRKKNSNGISRERLLSCINNDGIITNIFDIITSKENLVQAYWEIRSEPGNLTPGTDEERETLDGIREKWFQEASLALQEGRYAYRATEKIGIGRESNRTRPLTRTSPKDKIIEQAFRRIIEPFYEGSYKWVEIPEQEYQTAKEQFSYRLKAGRDMEDKSKADYKSLSSKYYEKVWEIPKIFSERSHGFRPNRGVHSAIREISTWQEVNWILNYDIKKAYDSLHKKKLTKMIRQRIADRRVTDELNKMFQCQIIGGEIGGMSNEKSVAPPGSILSPLLLNIYMTELDNFVKNLKTKFDLGPLSTVTKRECDRMRNTYGTKSTFGKKHGAPLACEKGREALMEYYKQHSSAYNQKTYRRLRYIRYADDFIIGIGGSKADAKEVQKQINDFIKGNLHLEVEKDKLTHLTSDIIEFLGFVIRKPDQAMSKKLRSYPKIIEKYRRNKNRVLARLHWETSKFDRFAEKLARNKVGKKIEALLTDWGYRWRKKENISKGAEIIAEELFLKKAGEILEQMRSEHQNKTASLQAEARALAESRKRLILPKAKDTKNGRQHIDQRELGYDLRKWIEAIRTSLVEGWKDLGSLVPSEILESRKSFLEAVGKEYKGLAHHEKAHTLAVKATAWKSRLRKNTTEEERVKYAAMVAILPIRNNILIEANIKEIMHRLKDVNIVYKKSNEPKPADQLITVHAIDIINWYGYKARGILNFYRCARNFHLVKNIVDYQMRMSLMYTIAKKEASSISKISSKYGKDVTVTDGKGKPLVKFISKGEPFSISHKFIGREEDLSLSYLDRLMTSGGNEWV